MDNMAHSDEISDGNEDYFIGDWNQDHFSHEVAQNLAALYINRGALWRSELKSNEVRFFLAEEICKQNIDMAALLLLTVYVEAQEQRNNLKMEFKNKINRD